MKKADKDYIKIKSMFKKKFGNLLGLAYAITIAFSISLFPSKILFPSILFGLFLLFLGCEIREFSVENYFALSLLLIVFSPQSTAYLFSLWILQLALVLVSLDSRINPVNIQLNIMPNEDIEKPRRIIIFYENILLCLPIILSWFNWANIFPHTAIFYIYLSLLVGLVINAITLIFQFFFNSRNRYNKLIRKTLEDIQKILPEFIFYFGGTKKSPYHINIWLQYLIDTERPFLLVVRDQKMIGVLRGKVTVPVLYIKSIYYLEKIQQIPSFKAVFYPSNAIKNSSMCMYNRLNHVFLGHGDSEKMTSINPVTVKLYDKIFVAGQAAIDRYTRNGIKIDESKFVIVGLPRVSNILIENEILGTPPVLLYAPTWIGHSHKANYSSLSVGLKMIKQATELGYEIIFRPHPISKSDPASLEQIKQIKNFLLQDSKTNKLNHRYDASVEAMDLADCINLSSVMISDNSSVIVDYLYSLKPFAIVDTQNKKEAFLEELPLLKGGYSVNADLSNLEAILKDQFTIDPKKESRKELKKYYLGDFSKEEYCKTFQKAVHAILDRA